MKSTDLATTNWREMVPASVAAQADQWQGRVHQAIAASVMVTGQALRAMKPLMDGAFEAWWRQELGLKDRKLVSDLMAASELLETQADDTPLSKLPPRTLAILQRAGSGYALEAAVERLENGQRVTEVEARRIAANSLKGKLKPSQVGRMFGYLNDERSAILAGYINGRKQAQARFEALAAAADLDPKLSCMTNDERIAEAQLADGHPLAKLMDEALGEVIKAGVLADDYRQWTVKHPTTSPAADDPIWAAAFGNDGGMVAVYNELRSWAAREAKALSGHRDPEGAIRLWMQEAWCPRDRKPSGWEQLAPVALDGWEPFIKGFLQLILDNG